MHYSVAIYFWEGMYLCVVGVREDICAQKRMLCSGTRGQTNLNPYDENQEEIFHSEELPCTYTGGWLILGHRIVPQQELSHFCWVVTLGMYVACN